MNTIINQSSGRYKTLFHATLLGLVALLASSCYKDKGHYDIQMPTAPTVTGLDTVYHAVVGDSLIIEPQISGLDPNQLEAEWRISVPESAEGRYIYEGLSLRTVFGLKAQRYRARLTVHNTANGMKYFYDFLIDGVTEFSQGSLVLSEENGTTRLSFIKPDDTVQPRIYEAINQKQLPDNPKHVFYLANQFTGFSPMGYWVITENDGVRLDVSTLAEDELKPATLADNFFLAPPTIEVGSLQAHAQGVLMGVINGKFYGGVTTTWDQAATYGMFGTYTDGDYELAPQFVMSTVNGQVSMIAYDKVRQQFLRFNVYGAPTFFGTQYETVNGGIFDPKNVGMDLVAIVQINNADTYAYCRDQAGTLYELKFNVNFNGPFTFTAGHKREFVRPDLIGDDVKIVATRTGNIYLASGNQVFRYNPLNENIQALEATLDGEVTMLKLSDDEQTLIVGSEGRLSYLSIQTGQNGPLLKRIEGIPGAPVDMTWRN